MTHDNCPHQSVICGPAEQVAIAVERLRAERVIGGILEYPRGGFHTSPFADYTEMYRNHLEGLQVRSPSIPFWSATTCAPYPSDPESIRELALLQLLHREVGDDVRQHSRGGVNYTVDAALPELTEDAFRGRAGSRFDRCE